MSFKIQYILIFGILLLFLSCEEEKESINKEARKIEKERKSEKGIIRGSSTSKYTGKAGQLVVVAENTVIDTIIEQILDTTFGEQIRPYYPVVPKFEIAYISPDRFKKSHQRLRNVLRFTLTDEKLEGGSELLIRLDYFARGQIYTEIKANTINDLHELLTLEADRLVNLYDEKEWKREYARFKRKSNPTVKRRLKEDFGISLEVPQQAVYEYNGRNFAKIMFPDRSRNMEIMSPGGSGGEKANFIYSGLMIWEVPYKKESQFKPDYLLKVRDTLLKYNAKHEFPGVYMGTQDHPAVEPVYNYIKIGNVEGYEFKGMFKFTGRLEPSGGKFWSFHFIHPKRNKIIALSGYLDSPPTVSPMLFLRQIQASLYSLKILED